MLEINPLIAFTAGLVAIISPCVLPLLPALVSATQGQSKLRPVAIVGGLALTFTIMGVIASAFGEAFIAYQQFIYAGSIVVIMFMGVLMLYDLHLPINLRIINHISYKTYSIKTEGTASGFLLGAALGIVWLPCTGPVLGAILSMVATEGSILTGAIMLLIFSAGFSVPLLAIAYSSRLTSLIVGKTDRMILIRRLSGAVLLIAGIYMVLPYIAYV